jgi:AcrR family transcriptional regulator
MKAMEAEQMASTRAESAPSTPDPSPAPSTPDTPRTTNTPRMTREQSKANTRERLLSAARTVFARGGFHGASVEEIASEAGFSTGALYSNFGGKEDLFLALMDREIEGHAREIAQAVGARSSVAERATGGARQWMTMIEREPELLLLFMEFWAYGVRDPEVRPKVAARFAQMRQVLTQLIADGTREFELELDIPAEQLAIAIDALADGIARQKLADPQAVPDDLMGKVLSLLFSAATRPAATRPAGGAPRPAGTDTRSAR